MKINLLFLVLIIYSLTNAQETVIVNDVMYGIDHDKKLIVSNENVNEINSNYPNTKSEISLDVNYTFLPPVQTVETGVAYQVVNSFNNQIYTLYFTELPLIYINATDEITDAPKVWASFTLTESNGNSIASDIGIEIRGGFSQTLPKKSFEIEFWEDNTGDESVDVSLLGMRTDSDWNLQAMFNEPLRFLSKTNNDLWKLFHTIHYIEDEPEAVNGIKMTYSEMFLNGEYRGVYAVSEKINRKQLKLKKHNGNIRGELYKGDQWGNGAVTFSWLGSYNNNSDVWDGFEYKHPKEEIDWSNLYNLVDFVKNSNNADFYAQYQNKFQLDNLVDYFIFLNLLRATDNTGKNLYIAKYDTDELYFYVPWDLDGTFGINWYGGQDNTTNDILRNKLYDRLWEDCSQNGFREKLRNRWNSARQSVFNQDFLMGKFQEAYNYLSENGVYQREEIAWTDYYTEHYHLDYMSNWMTHRLAYLDTKFNELCPNAGVSDVNTNIVEIYPKPASDYLYFHSSENHPLMVSVYDMQGKKLIEQKMENSNSHLSVSSLVPGTYIIKIKTDKAIQTEKIIISK